MSYLRLYVRMQELHQMSAINFVLATLTLCYLAVNLVMFALNACTPARVFSVVARGRAGFRRAA